MDIVRFLFDVWDWLGFISIAVTIGTAISSLVFFPKFKPKHNFMVLSAVIITFSFLLFILCMIVGKNYVYVNDVSGMTIGSARQTLSEKDLNVKLLPNQYSEEYNNKSATFQSLKEVVVPKGYTIYIGNSYEINGGGNAINSDGNLKISFYNGNFAYRKSENDEVYIKNDVLDKFDYSYLSEKISPVAYITIIDSEGNITDYPSVHVSECSIPLNYGDYKVQVSCDNYNKYTVNLSLTPDNKISNTWSHNVYLIPDNYLVENATIRLVDENDNPYILQEVEIGYQGNILNDTTDENGYIAELFKLSKGEYIVSLGNKDFTSFSINELSDNKNIVVKIPNNQGSDEIIDQNENITSSSIHLFNSNDNNCQVEVYSNKSCYIHISKEYIEENYLKRKIDDYAYEIINGWSVVLDTPKSHISVQPQLTYELDDIEVLVYNEDGSWNQNIKETDISFDINDNGVDVFLESDSLPILLTEITKIKLHNSVRYLN